MASICLFYLPVNIQLCILLFVLQMQHQSLGVNFAYSHNDVKDRNFDKIVITLIHSRKPTENLFSP